MIKLIKGLYYGTLLTGLIGCIWTVSYMEYIEFLKYGIM
jgi:hypothetical protein